MGTRLRRWVLPGLLATVPPKCLLCVLAYAGLGLGGPELCGDTNEPTAHGIAWLAVLSAVVLAVGSVVASKKSRPCR
jgi:hypothetical protein